MNIVAVRAAAFVVGSMIAGCVYTTDRTSAQASGKSTPLAAVYPAARQTVGNIDGDRADVTLRLPMVSLHMRAQRYDSNDAPLRVIAFYRKELAKRGKVSEERGGPHTKIEGFRWISAADQTTLAVGHTIVAIKPRAEGSEFALIQIEAGAPNQPEQH